MSTDGQRTKWRRNSVENFNRLSRAHERYRQTDRQTTDGRRRHIANENVSSRSLTNKFQPLSEAFSERLLSRRQLAAAVPHCGSVLCRMRSSFVRLMLELQSMQNITDDDRGHFPLGHRYQHRRHAWIHFHAMPTDRQPQEKPVQTAV